MKTFNVYCDDMLICKQKAIDENQAKTKVLIDSQNISPRISTYVPIKDKKELRKRLRAVLSFN